MNIDEVIKRISKTDGLSKTLGMHFISTPEPDTLRATMKVDERNSQPFGFLSGTLMQDCKCRQAMALYDYQFFHAP